MHLNPNAKLDKYSHDLILAVVEGGERSFLRGNVNILVQRPDVFVESMYNSDYIRHKYVAWLTNFSGHV